MLATKKIKEEDSSEKESESKENSIEPYTVDKILDKKKSKGKILYKVKWKNYPLSQCTWEPIENFIDKSVINDFENELKGKTEKRKPGRPPKKKENKSEEEESEDNSDNKEESSDSKEKTSESQSSNEKKSSEENSNSSSEKKSSEENSSSSNEKKSSESESNSIKNILERRKKKIGNIKNDIPERIISSKQNVEVPSDLCCFVEWKVRKDGTKPDNSYVKNSEIKEKYPYVLLDYYEEQIMLSSKKRKRTYSVDSKN